MNLVYLQVLITTHFIKFSTTKIQQEQNIKISILNIPSTQHLIPSNKHIATYANYAIHNVNFRTIDMDNYLKKLIKEGENQQLDFKYCVSDSRKIARTLSAFANSNGGKILIGVRDNGRIAGIKSDEEYYMVDTVAQLFCRPKITYSIKQHMTGGKTILEVEVLKGNKRPY
jgi:hypothetical protein